MENNIGMVIGKNISALRKQKGLTQEGLASELGVSFQAVSKWETGQSCPDIGLLPLIADLFSIHIDELFGRAVTIEPRFDIVDELPWCDDEKVRMVVFKGKKLIDRAEAVKEFTFRLEGEAKNVECHGNISGSISAGGSVNCKNIKGSVNAGGMVNCGSIGSSLKSGGMVNCGNIGGNLKANGIVNCGNVSGSAVAAGDINCGNVGDNVEAKYGSVTCANISGHINCDSIKGDFIACGDISCITIDGNVTMNGGTLNCDNIRGKVL